MTSPYVCVVVGPNFREPFTSTTAAEGAIRILTAANPGTQYTLENR